MRAVFQVSGKAGSPNQGACLRYMLNLEPESPNE